MGTVLLQTVRNFLLKKDFTRKIMKTLSLFILPFLIAMLVEVNGSCGSCPHCVGICFLGNCQGLCLPLRMEEHMKAFSDPFGNCSAVPDFQDRNCLIEDDNCQVGKPNAIDFPLCNCFCVEPPGTCKAERRGKWCQILEDDCTLGNYPTARSPRCDCQCTGT